MNEEALLNFVIVLARILKRTDGTIKQKLFAIRYAHLVVGFPDPLLHRSRLWSTLAGVKDHATTRHTNSKSTTCLSHLARCVACKSLRGTYCNALTGGSNLCSAAARVISGMLRWPCRARMAGARGAPLTTT